MPQQNASLSWIVTLVVFAFFVGVLVGVLLVNRLTQPGVSQLTQPQAAPAANQQTAYQMPAAVTAAVSPQADDYASAMAAGLSTAFYKIEQPVVRLTERVSELNKAQQRLADTKIQLTQADAQARAIIAQAKAQAQTTIAQAESQAQTIIAQAESQKEQRLAAMRAEEQEQALRRAERAALGMTLSVITIAIVTMLMIGVLALIAVAVWRRLQQPPTPPPSARQIAPRADQMYWLKRRREAQANERAERRQHLREKATPARSDRPYYDLPLAVMDDEE